MLENTASLRGGLGERECLSLDLAGVGAPDALAWPGAASLVA